MTYNILYIVSALFNKIFRLLKIDIIRYVRHIYISFLLTIYKYIVVQQFKMQRKKKNKTEKKKDKRKGCFWKTFIEYDLKNL